MTNSTKITKNNKSGLIFTQSLNADGTAKLDKNGAEHGYLRVQSDEISLGFGYNGGLKSRSALIAMTVAGWEKSKHALVEGTVVPGVILIEESTKPFFDAEKEVKRAGVDGPVLTIQGQPIYKRMYYTENKAEIAKGDILVAHDNDVKATVVAKPAAVLNSTAE